MGFLAGGAADRAGGSTSPEGVVSYEVRSADGRPVRVTSPAPVVLWDGIVARDPNALAFHTPRWLGSIEQATAWRNATRLYEVPDGRQLVLLMAARRDPAGLFRMQASWPASWGSGGIVAAGGVRPDEVAVVIDDLRKGRAVATSIRPSFTAAGAWALALSTQGGRLTTIGREVHVAVLDGTFPDFLRRNVSKRARQYLYAAERQQERFDLAVQSGNSPQLIEDFYAVYTAWLAQRAAGRGVPPGLAVRRGQHVEPLARLRAVAGHLGGDCRITVAALEGRPVGAVIMLTGGQTAVYWRAYSDHAVPRGVRLADTLLLGAVEAAYDLGCRYFEMGESGGSRSLAEFKRRLGGEPRGFEEYRIERLPLSRLRGSYEASLSIAERQLTAAAASVRKTGWRRVDPMGTVAAPGGAGRRGRRGKDA